MPSYRYFWRRWRDRPERSSWRHWVRNILSIAVTSTAELTSDIVQLARLVSLELWAPLDVSRMNRDPQKALANAYQLPVSAEPWEQLGKVELSAQLDVS